MDNLAKCAKEAKKAGISYGRYMALKKTKLQPRKIPEGWIACEWCGKYFKPHQSNQRYCEIGCRSEAYQEKIRKEKKNESST